MNQLHLIQREIFKKLQFAEELSFSDLKPLEDIENNKFDFHLKQLIRFDYVEKSDDKYRLTENGKKYIASLDTKSSKIETGAMNIAWLVCTRGKVKDMEVLCYTRLKQPYFGCQGYPAGKIKNGESIADAAIRELKEETNLEGVPKVKGLYHLRTYSKQTNDLVQDKFMYLCHFDNPKGEIIDSYEGKNEWIKVSDLDSFLTKPFSDKGEYIRALECLNRDTPDLYFEEKENVVDWF